MKQRTPQGRGKFSKIIIQGTVYELTQECRLPKSTIKKAPSRNLLYSLLSELQKPFIPNMIRPNQQQFFVPIPRPLITFPHAIISNDPAPTNQSQQLQNPNTDDQLSDSNKPSNSEPNDTEALAPDDLLYDDMSFDQYTSEFDEMISLDTTSSAFTFY